MATSTATMNAQLEELASSLCSDTVKDFGQYKDKFIRRVKHHPFGRTNQFEVSDKLNGLEEKFQVLNNEDLSDELHRRRIELRDQQQNWLPDVLDLLLRLSDDPLHKAQLSRNQHKSSTNEPPEDELEEDDPNNNNDPLWAKPDFSDFSSEEDEIIPSTETSPASTTFQHLDGDTRPAKSVSNLYLEAESSLIHSQPSFWEPDGDQTVFTEIQVVRQILFMLQGLPTRIFTDSKYGIVPSSGIRSSTLSNKILNSCLSSSAVLGSKVATIRIWLSVAQDLKHLQALRDEAQEVFREFEKQLNDIQSKIVKPRGQIVVTLLQTLHDLEVDAKSINCLASLIVMLTRVPPCEALDVLFDHLNDAQTSGDDAAFEVLLGMFDKVMRLYLKPLQAWIQHGVVPDDHGLFFVSKTSAMASPSVLWQERFHLHTTGERKISNFLQPFAAAVFACGKTNAFLRVLQIKELPEQSKLGQLEAILDAKYGQSDLRLSSFTASFMTLFQEQVNYTLRMSTSRLRDALSTVGLSQSLQAISLLYFHAGMQTAMIDTKLFRGIDRNLATWNDRFLVADLYANAFSCFRCFDTSRLAIYSSQTSSRTIQSRRRSVKILGSLAIDYKLPWAISNIVLPETLTSYRRVNLLLFQFRRAKHSLERTGFFHVRNTPLGNTIEQKLAQIIHSALLVFVNTFYDHLTTCVIDSLKLRLDTAMTAATTVDKMISAHNTFASDLETSCLVSKNLIPLHNTIITILDLCIQFCDVVSAESASRHRRGSDFEVQSYTSAQSRGKNNGKSRAASDEDDEEDDEGEGAFEGYSSFVAPEDGQLMTEINKIRTQFARNSDFLVAGLGGVSRTGKNGTWFSILASRLDWKHR